MELRPGYKQTEAGLIPEDWDEVALKDCARSIVRGASPRPIDDPKWFDNRSHVGWLRISDVTSAGRFLTETVQYLSDAGIRKSRRVAAGGLVMSICATVGRPIEIGIDVCIHDGFVFFDKLSVEQGFLYHVLTYLEPRWSRRGQTGSQMNLNTGLIKGTKVAIPRAPSEQSAISAALSDIDALLAAQDAMIAKKRAIKQGAMQELLTGKRRLPGFSGEWIFQRLGTAAVLKARIGWQGLTTAEYLDSGDYYLVTGTDFLEGRIDWANCAYVSKSRYDQDPYIQIFPRDVLVTKDGTIGKVAVVDTIDKPGTLNSGVFVVRPKNCSFVPEFFYYLLQSEVFDKFLVQLSAGSTINHLYQKDFVAFAYQLPPTAGEQIAIAEVLSDMDSEIVDLEAKRSKFALLKQGMKQALLTGRIRLV